MINVEFGGLYSFASYIVEDLVRYNGFFITIVAFIQINSFGGYRNALCMELKRKFRFSLL